jgi:hypothetical protein
MSSRRWCASGTHRKLGLAAGDLGAILHVMGLKPLEVEFVTPLGRTQALLTPPFSDVRRVRDDHLLAVRTSPSFEERRSTRIRADALLNTAARGSWERGDRRCSAHAPR